jgi:alpha-glucosidase
VAVQVEAGSSGATPGELLRWHAEEARVLVEYERATISIGILSAGSLHVRVSRDNGFAPRRSWSVLPSDERFPSTPWRASGRGDSVVVLTSELAVALGQDGRISISDPSGRRILDDADGGLAWCCGESGATWKKHMPDGERYYGFGERLGALEKRGRRYTCWTTDEWRHQGPTTDELYVAIPFFMGLRTGCCYGVLLDNTYRTVFDLTDIARRVMTWRCDGGELDWYFFAGPEPARVVERLSEVAGRMPLLPRWALGYHQSRWGYASADEVLTIARKLRARRIPADAIHLDLDHMDEGRVFTWSRDGFPQPDRTICELRDLGFATVVLVSAGVKREPGYAVYDTGHERDVFLKRSLQPGGEEFAAQVWPGLCVFPDHLRSDVRAWWGEQYREHARLGVRGFLNDMNEPAMHDLPIDHPDTRNLEPPPDLPHGSDGEVVTHAEARNAYAVNENRGAYEFLRNQFPDERPFLLSRSGGVGIQQFAGVWTGDLSSVWEHLEASLPQLLGLGLSGVPFVGTDIGGFFESCGPELLLRWTQLGVVMPLARNHSAKNTASQEPWAWGGDVEDACRRAIELRYRLLPYLYTLAEEASRTGIPILRPMFFHHAEDETTWDLSDQALLGRDLLVAPIVHPGVRERSVYLPVGRWTDLRTGRIHSGPGWSALSGRLDEDLPMLARAGSILAFGPCIQHTAESAGELELRVFPDGGGAQGRLYEDDGSTFRYASGESRTTAFSYTDGIVRARGRGAFQPPARSIRVVVGDRVAELHDSGEWDVDLR